MESAIRLYAWNLDYAKGLVEDISAEQCTESMGPGLENHPAWTIGHLVTGSDLLAFDLGLERDLPVGWQDLFERQGPGDPRLPNADRSVYPPMEALILELERQHARVEDQWRKMLAEDAEAGQRLEAPLDWRYCKSLPTLSDAVVFLAVSHESMHLGQLAAWRRAVGLPSALNRL